MSIILLIAGTADEAKAALLAHDIPPSYWLSPPREGDEVTETMACVKEECEPGVASWYVEPPTSAPYPPGTLLYYKSNRRT